MFKVSKAGVILALSICLSGCSFKVVDNEVKKDKELFGRWIEPNPVRNTKPQEIFNDVPLHSIKGLIGPDYLLFFKKRYQENKDNFVSILPILSKVFPCSFDAQYGLASVGSSTQFASHIGHVTQLLENDMPGFISHLRDLKLNSPWQEEHDTTTPSNEIINQYNRFLELFFLHEEAESPQELEYMRAVANRMFEYAFGQDTWPQFHKIILTKIDHPIARMLYSAMWYYLAGSGWKQWHRQCLDALKREHDKGKRIVYIAGGSDMYQLIKYGIYSIDLIDPILPTQPRYYSDGWAWLVREGGIGDSIIFTFKDRTVVARRTGFKPKGFFKAKLSNGQIGDIPKSVTTWTFSDKASGKRLGTWLIHRRFSQQSDFVANVSRAVVMSFNELYFVATQSPAKSWGINPALFDDSFTMFIKQLRRPVTKAMIKNMAEASASAFNFISLGSEIN